MLEVVVGMTGTALLAVIGWAFNTQSRISVLEQQHLDLKELINTRFDSSDARLGRIERSMNGKLV